MSATVIECSNAKISYFMCENLIYYNLTFEKSLSKKRQINQLEYFVKCVFLRFGHPDPEGSGRVSRQDCIQMPSYHLKPKSAL